MWNPVCDYITLDPKIETITKEEFKSLEKMKNYFNNFYIVRNKNNSLRLFTKKPTKTDSTWEYIDKDYFNDIDAGVCVDSSMFSFIDWESNKAWGMVELMKLKVIE